MRHFCADYLVAATALTASIVAGIAARLPGVNSEYYGKEGCPTVMYEAA
jgi:hypothetical protein